MLLSLLLGYDRIDGSNCAGAEYACRRLVMLERAAKVNPKCPTFVGLFKMIEHSLDEGGGLATREFTAFMAQVAEADARILKQNRLLREEMASKNTDSAGDGGGGGGGTASALTPAAKRKQRAKGGGGGSPSKALSLRTGGWGLPPAAVP